MFGALAVGWTGDASADAAHDAGAAPEAISPNADPPDGGLDSGFKDDWPRDQPRGIAIYGTPPSPHSGC